MFRTHAILCVLLALTPLTGQPFRKHLPATDSLAHADGILRWGGAEGFVVVDANARGDATLDLAPGRVVVDRHCLTAGAPAVAALRGFVQTAREAGVRLAGCRMRRFYLLEFCLLVGNKLICAEGVLTGERPARPSNRQLHHAITRASDGLEFGAIGAVARKSVLKLLECLTQPDGATDEGSEIPPRFARSLVRHGWLADYAQQTDTLRAAVVAAATLSTRTVYASADSRVEFLSDAFNTIGIAVSTPQRCGYVIPLPTLEYHYAAPQLTLEVHLPPGSDVRRDVAKATAARVFQGFDEIASWRKGHGFKASLAGWRKAVVARHSSLPDQIVSNFIPPHVLVRDLAGDAHALVTAHGTLFPPRDATAGESARFIHDAAAVLPDAAHLDLIGEYLFCYVYDSPDPTLPFLIGNAKLKGEIHQTARQTLQTACGGVCRGDCDDIAELYQAILDAQGKLNHVLDLPGHAAVAWVEPRADGTRHTFVLHTQPPLEFAGADARASLLAAYRSFYAGQPIDANQLPINLRFAGDNIRSNWVLSYRIFEDPVYARTMIDVQRDWHYHTYRQGVAKMEQLIARGDDDPANFLELAGLAERSGQWLEAERMLKKALRQDDDLVTRSQTEIRTIGNVLAAEEKRGTAMALDVLGRHLEKAQAPELVQKLVYLDLQLAESLLSTGNDPKHALLALDSLASTYVASLIDSTRAYVRSPQFGRNAWTYSDRWVQLRDLMSTYTNLYVAALGDAPVSVRARQMVDGRPKPVSSLAHVESWLTGVAFQELSEPGTELARYTTAALFYEALLGKPGFLARLTAAPLPTKKIDHAQRTRGPAQLQRDLGWIKISVPYWTTAMQRMFTRGHTVDAARVQAIAKSVATAAQHGAAIDVITPVDARSAETVVLYAALMRGDVAVVRAHCRKVAQMNDTWYRDDTTAAFASVAPHLPVERFGAMLRIWHEEVHYKPAYFEIAWTAVTLAGKAQALAVARLAAAAFPDDRTFAEELAFMEKLLK